MSNTASTYDDDPNNAEESNSASQSISDGLPPTLLQSERLSDNLGITISAYQGDASMSEKVYDYNCRVYCSFTCVPEDNNIRDSLKFKLVLSRQFKICYSIHSSTALK